MSARDAAPGGADEQIVLDDDGASSCSVWWREPPAFGDHRVGRIGGYQAANETSGRTLLQRACDLLAANGSTLAVGPMDGSTWHRYRFVTERGSEPPFFLEPDNPDDWPAHFRAAGFQTLAHYTSALDRGLEIRDERAARIEAALAAAGVTVRQLDVDAFDAEMRAVHRASIESFARNFLYSPIGEEEFVAMYAPLKPHVDPALVLIAEHASAVAGFVFGLPDLLRRQRGEALDTMIVKTLARRPGPQFAGLGSVLLERCRRAAHGRGYTRCIHALMYDDNASVGLSERFGATMRGYALFAKVLARA